MFGCVVKNNVVARIGKKRRPRRHRLKNPVFALFAQVVFDTIMSRHKPHQAFALMGIEIVGDKMPPRRLWISAHGLLNMSHEVFFGARWSYRGRDHLALSDIEVGDSGQGPMTQVFEVAALHSTRTHGNRGVFALQGLDTAHLIGRHHAFTGFQQSLGFKIEIGKIGHLLIGHLIGLGGEPVAASMWFEIDLILKNDRHGARK